MQKGTEFGQKEELFGFCKDLMELIAKQMGIKCMFVSFAFTFLSFYLKKQIMS